MTEPRITPPPKLVQQWNLLPLSTEEILAVAWLHGANTELDAICHWLRTGPYGASIACHAEQLIFDLQYARRPKPPSAIEQAESLIERHEDGWVPNPAQWHVIREGLAEGRRALEALPDD